MRNTENPINTEIQELIKDKMHGLPMHEKLTIETYEEKKIRFDKTETFLMNLVADTNDDKLMHTFLRWQKIRIDLNELFLKDLGKFHEL